MSKKVIQLNELVKASFIEKLTNTVYTAEVIIKHLKNTEATQEIALADTESIISEQETRITDLTNELVNKNAKILSYEKKIEEHNINADMVSSKLKTELSNSEAKYLKLLDKTTELEFKVNNKSNTKLTCDTVKAIRVAVKKGMPRKTAAKKYKTSISTISRIVNNILYTKC